MILTDESLMPWGKYRDTPLINVPVSYIDWLKTLINTKPPLRRGTFERAFLVYCEEMKDALNKERDAISQT